MSALHIIWPQLIISIILFQQHTKGKKKIRLIHFVTHFFFAGMINRTSLGFVFNGRSGINLMNTDNRWDV